MRRFNWIYFFIYLAFLFLLLLVLLSVFVCFLFGSLCAIYVIAAVRLFHYVFFILFYFIVLDTLFAFHSNKIIHIYLIIGCECVVFVFVFFASFKYKWYDVDWFTGRDFFVAGKRTTFMRWKCVFVSVCDVLACCFIDIDWWI